jgi:hypothetical protein
MAGAPGRTDGVDVDARRDPQVLRDRFRVECEVVEPSPQLVTAGERDAARPQLLSRLAHRHVPAGEQHADVERTRNRLAVVEAQERAVGDGECQVGRGRA